MKVEKDMIELTILEASCNIENTIRKPGHGGARKWSGKISRLAI
jgi:hypothetical protein